MRRRSVLFALGASVLALSVWFGYALLVDAGAKAPDSALRTVKTSRGVLEVTAAATGTFQAMDYVDVGAQLSGQLKAITVRLGDTVQRGQLVAEIDDATARARLAQTEASLASVQAQIASKQAQAELARVQRDRNGLLVRRGFISVSTQEIADASVSSLTAEVDSLRAQAANLAATVDQATTELRFAKVNAPMDGIVVALVARPGQTLNANQQAPVILRIADTASLALMAQASEADVINIRPGTEARFALLGLANRDFSGRVRQILPSPNIVNGVVFYDVLIEVPREQEFFRIGMTAQVLFILKRYECMLKIPRVALPADLRPPRSVTLAITSAGRPPSEVPVHIEAVSDTEGGIPCDAADRAGLADGANVAVSANPPPNKKKL